MAYRRRGGNKYNARKAVIDGIIFDSSKEAKRYRTLKEKAENGQITSLQRQVKFVLIPAQREPDQIGPRGGKKPGKLLERECAYIADFVYTGTARREGETQKAVLVFSFSYKA